MRDALNETDDNHTDIAIFAVKSKLSAERSVPIPRKGGSLRCCLAIFTYYRLRLNFRGTKLSQIANLHNIHGFYFRRKWEWIDTVDHLEPGKLCNKLISNEALSVFALPIQYKGDNKARVRSASIFSQFCNACSKYLQIKLFTVVFWTAKTMKVLSCENLSPYGITFYQKIMWLSCHSAFQDSYTNCCSDNGACVLTTLDLLWHFLTLWSQATHSM